MNCNLRQGSLIGVFHPIVPPHPTPNKKKREKKKNSPSLTILSLLLAYLDTAQLFMKILFIILHHLFAKKGQIQWRPLITDPMNCAIVQSCIIILLTDSQQVIMTHLSTRNSISLSSKFCFLLQCRLRDMTYSAPITVDIEYTRGSQVNCITLSIYSNVHWYV